MAAVLGVKGVAGILTGIDLIMQLLDRAAAMGATLKKARAENRDITEEELDTLAAEYDKAAADLRAEIARQRAAPK